MSIKPRKKEFTIVLCLVLLLGIFFLSTGCSSKQKVFLKSDGSGTADITVRLQPILMQYAKDIAGGFTSGQGASGLQFFDREKIRKQIAAMPHVSLQSIETSSSEKIRMVLSFDRINKIFPASGNGAAPALFQFKTANGRKTLVFTLTAENFSSLMGFLGFGGNELFATFGPQKGKPLTKKEYTAMIVYLFDEYAAKDKIDSILKNSYIEAELTVQGVCKAVESSPAVRVSCKGSHADIKIPLIDVLTLNNPVGFKITWN